MYYEENKIQWRRGDTVLHDADAKEPRMLMVIVGFTRDGLAKCQYVDKRHKRTIYRNDLKYLHDPKNFGVNRIWNLHGQAAMERYQDEFERVRAWNRRYQVGRRVRTTSADGGWHRTEHR